LKRELLGCEGADPLKLVLDADAGLNLLYIQTKRSLVSYELGESGKPLI